MPIFFVFVSLAWAALQYYVGRRLLTDVPRDVPRWSASWWVRCIVWGLIAAFVVLPFAAMMSGRVFTDLGASRAAYMVGFMTMGVASILLSLVLLADLARLLVRAGAWLRSRLFSARGSDEALLDDGRRRFFRRALNVGLVGAAGSMGAAGHARASRTPGVVEVEVPIEGLPAALEGFRIVQLTDIHVGPTIRKHDLEAMVERANALEPDVIAVTGDLIDGFVDQLREQVAPLGGLKARHGAYFVTGNHEYYWDGPAWCDYVASLGLEVLNNAHRVVEHEGASVLVAGVTDVRAEEFVASHRSDPHKAREGAPPCDVSLLLAHQPRSVDAASAAGFDLQISGHTHGGQYFPMNLIIHLVQPYVAGLHRHRDTWIYVSRGSGYWGPPLRLGAPSEITLLRLVRAA